MSDATVTSSAMSRVLLLYGGRSAEHEVSCTSAVAVQEALVGAGHQVIAVGIAAVALLLYRRLSREGPEAARPAEANARRPDSATNKANGI